MATAKKSAASRGVAGKSSASLPKTTGREAKETKLYTVLTPVEHDREPYDVGDLIELNGRQAAQLLEVGAIEPADSVEADQPQT